MLPGQAATTTGRAKPAKQARWTPRRLMKDIVAMSDTPTRHTSTKISHRRKKKRGTSSLSNVRMTSRLTELRPSPLPGKDLPYHILLTLVPPPLSAFTTPTQRSQEQRLTVGQALTILPTVHVRLVLVTASTVQFVTILSEYVVSRIRL